MNNNQSAVPTGLIARFLNFVERVGNKLPDPAIIFLFAMLLIWFLSWWFSGVSFDAIDPRTGEAIIINNMLASDSLATFLSSMVKTFTGFAPLGVVLVAMLGVGVAEHSGFINTGLKLMLKVTPKKLLTPSIILVAIVSHTATDAGYVLVIPLAGVIFYAAGRHPLAGIAAAFAGVSGGFGANFIPSGIDPLLQSFTQSAAQIINPAMTINPLNNWAFASASSLFIVALGWYITDKIIEPRLQKTAVDGAKEDLPVFEDARSDEKRAFIIASSVMVAGLALLAYVSADSNSAMRSSDGSLTNFSSPLMQSIVPLIFYYFGYPARFTALP